jgi:hypothetical protein
MPRKVKSKTVQTKKNGQRARPVRRRPKKLLSVKNPLNQDISLWEIELLDISEAEFLELWHSGDDRIGYHLGERAIYDKGKVIARIVKEVKIRKEADLEEE